MQRKHLLINWDEFIDGKTYWIDTPSSVRYFIELWKKENHIKHPTLSFVQVFMLNSLVTYNLRENDYSSSNFYTYVLSMMESNFAFNGEMPGEPIYTAFDEAVQSIKHLIAVRRG